MDDLCLTPPFTSLGYRLSLVRHLWARRADAALDPTGLTHMQFFMMRMIEQVSGLGRVPSQTHLAGALHTDRMTVSKVVRTLEAKGIVERAVHPDDPRANSVALTSRGRSILADATRLVTAEQDRFFGQLGPDRAKFGTMLDRLLAGEAPCAPSTLALEAR
jgi:DNA-binding MarR family transcriptional regulator